MSISSKTPRFVFYSYEIAIHSIFIGINLLLVILMISQYAQRNPPYQMCNSNLTSLIGLKRDCHDPQWQAYRQNILILICFCFIWKIIMQFIPKMSQQHIWIYGLIMLIFSFRADLFLYLCITSFWYIFTHIFYKYKHFIPTCWAIMIFTLFLNEYCDHFRSISNLMHLYVPINFLKNNYRAIHCSQLLNMTFLRLISFAIDRKRGTQSRQLQKHQQKCQECTNQNYCQKARDYCYPNDYSFRSYMNYILFAPTLLTGPPTSYNNHHSFIKMPISIQPSYLRCILLLISFQLFQHWFPVISLSDSQTLIEAEIFSLFHLIFIWYKFLIIWKIARSWALLYGINPIDNMSRCVCNNYGFEGFWRMWHRGFNHWLIRYLYIPLGGNNNLYSVLAVVVFVAFWHDHNISIVLWALIIVLFMVPQIVIKRYFQTNYSHLYPKQWFKYASAVVASIYIYLMVIANIIGFGYGFQKSSILLIKLQQQWFSLLWTIITLSSACILMFYTRNLQGNTKNY